MARSSRRIYFVDPTVAFEVHRFDRQYLGWKPIRSFNDDSVEYLGAICMAEEKKLVEDSKGVSQKKHVAEGVAVFCTSNKSRSYQRVCFAEHEDVGAFATLPAAAKKNPGLITFSSQPYSRSTHIKVWEGVELDSKFGAEKEKSLQCTKDIVIEGYNLEIGGFGGVLVLPDRRFVVVKDSKTEMGFNHRFVVFDLELKKGNEYIIFANETFFMGNYYVGAYGQNKGIQLFSAGTDVENFFKEVSFFSKKGIHSVAASPEHNLLAVLNKEDRDIDCHQIEIWNFNSGRVPTLTRVGTCLLPFLQNKNFRSPYYRKIHMAGHQLALELNIIDIDSGNRVSPKIALLDWNENKAVVIDRHQLAAYKEDIDNNLFVLKTGIGCSRPQASDVLSIFPWQASLIKDNTQAELEKVGMTPRVAELILQYAAEPLTNTKDAIESRVIKGIRYRMLHKPPTLYPISFAGDYFVERLNDHYKKAGIFHLNSLGELKEVVSQELHYKNLYLISAFSLNRVSSGVERFATFSNPREFVSYREIVTIWEKTSEFTEQGKLKGFSFKSICEIKLFPKQDETSQYLFHLFYRNRFLVIDEHYGGLIFKDHLKLTVIDVDRNTKKQFDLFDTPYAFVGSKHLVNLAHNGGVILYKVGDKLENFIDYSRDISNEVRIERGMSGVYSSSNGRFVVFDDIKESMFKCVIFAFDEKKESFSLVKNIRLKASFEIMARIIGDEFVYRDSSGVMAYHLLTGIDRCVLPSELIFGEVSIDKMGNYIKITDGNQTILVPQAASPQPGLTMGLFSDTGRVTNIEEEPRLMANLNKLIAELASESKGDAKGTDNSSVAALKYLLETVADHRELTYGQCVDEAIKRYPNLATLNLKFKDAITGSEATIQELLKKIKTFDPLDLSVERKRPGKS